MVDTEKALCFAPVSRRFFSLFYELFLLFSISLVFSCFLTLLQYKWGVLKGKDLFIAEGWESLLIQFFFFICIGFYFTYCWRKSGQTLAMRSWRIRLVCRHQSVLSWKRLWLRYFLALFFFPLSFLWVFFDSEKQFLHDKWCHTALVSVDS